MPDTYLGFDFGERRIGVATGQTITRSASPLITLKAVDNHPDWISIEKLITEWKPAALVVGIPAHLDGSASDMSKKAERFCRQLEGRFHLPVHRINESLTSFEAEQHLREKKKSTQHNKQEIDRMAAAIILQSWLDQLE
ncbi:MAG: putative pre6S rRNA nuclease [Pseudomonadota bacterium]|nr:putative pre6S rRNA nuclease [Pseudomonadota bacterium]